MYFLGFDIGTSGTKALLITDAGVPIASSNSGYPLSTPRPLWAEQNPDDWWEAVVKTSREVVAKAGIHPDEIGGIGLSGQMHGSVFLDSHGSVIRPAILWCDQRTEEECRWITEQVTQEALPDLIANPVLTGFTAPKIVWLRNHEPENYARVAKVLLPKDYIRFRLTGEFFTEVSDASGTALFDVRHRTWSERMLLATSIPSDWMPPCAESYEITARVSEQGAAECGLAVGTAVAGGGGDQAAGAVGSGIVESGIVSTTIGTSGVVFAHSDKFAIDPQMRIHTFCHAVPGKWHSMGVVLSAGGSLRWLRDTFYVSETKSEMEHGRDPYDLIMRDAAGVPAGAEGLVFLPYLTGERTPYPDPTARGSFVGITLRHTRAHFARAVLEGVAFALNDTFQIFSSLGIPINEVRASGGGGKSPLWRQILADVTRFEHRTLNIDEGPALGAALLAMVGTGRFGSVAEACATVISTVTSDTPNSSRFNTYREINTVYTKLYPVLKEPFQVLTKL